MGGLFDGNQQLGEGMRREGVFDVVAAELNFPGGDGDRFVGPGVR